MSGKLEAGTAASLKSFRFHKTKAETAAGVLRRFSIFAVEDVPEVVIPNLLVISAQVGVRIKWVPSERQSGTAAALDSFIHCRIFAKALVISLFVS